VRVVLTQDQESAFDPALRELNRRIYLHPRQAGSQFEDYAGDGVDVLALVDDAQSDGGELAGVDPQALATILGWYELQLDAYLTETAAAYRHGRLVARIASVQKDSPEVIAGKQGAIDRWKRLYQLNRSTVQAIGDV